MRRILFVLRGTFPAVQAAALHMQRQIMEWVLRCRVTEWTSRDRSVSFGVKRTQHRLSQLPDRQLPLHSEVRAGGESGRGKGGGGGEETGKGPSERQESHLVRTSNETRDTKYQ